MNIRFKQAQVIKVLAPTIVLLGAVSTYAIVTHRSDSQKSPSAEVAKNTNTSENESKENTTPSDIKPKEQKSGATPKASTAPKANVTAPNASTTPSQSPTAPIVSTPEPGGGVPAGGSCSVQPTAANTGSSGSLTSDGRSSLSTAGEIVQNKSFAGNLVIYADGVQLRNVTVAGDILLAEANDIVIDHVTTRSVALSSSSNATIQYSEVNAFEGDSFHITSDGSSYITNVTLRHNYIARPGFNPGSLSHWDGVQIRGANNVLIFCNNFDVGTWQDPYNVLIYLEQANGGNDNITVDNNWLSGSNFAFMIGLPHVPVNLSITNNKLFSAHFHYGYCYLGGGFTSTYLAQVIQAGNTLDGAAMTRVCTEGDL